MKKNRIIDSLIEYKKIFVPFFAVLMQIKDDNRAFLGSLDKQRRSGFICLRIFLSFYCSIVLLLPALPDGSVLNGITFIILFFLFFHLLTFFCSKSDVFTIKIGCVKSIRKETVIIFSSACFFIFFLSLLANFPGAKSPDTEAQWQQAQIFAFNDWHPVIHTLFIWLVSRIINHYAFVVFAQIAVFSFGVGYLAGTLEKWGFSKKIVLFTGCFIIFNPYTQNIMMYAWKDMGLTISITFLSIMMINIYLSGGEWLKKTTHIIAFSLFLGIAGKIRHNGIFFTIPLACLMPVCYFKQTKKSILCFVLTICVILAIQFPLYSALKVEFPHNTFKESVGIPMTIMGDVMVQDTENLPFDVKAFLNKIASDDEWRQKYRQGSYNHIKFSTNASAVVESVPVKDFINMTMRTVKSSPGYALLAVRKVTGFVWELSGRIDMISVPAPNAQKTNIIQRILNIGFRLYDKIILSCLPLAYIWTKVGWSMLLLLLFGLAAFCRNGKNTLILVVPSVAYNLGTMLLLCGYDIRFFHFNVVISVPFVLLLLAKEKTQNPN